MSKNPTVLIERLPQGIRVTPIALAYTRAHVPTVKVEPLGFTAADLAWFKRPLGAL